jgi:Fe-S oxidoreductase/nitrate reductase gamma subunit
MVASGARAAGEAVVARRELGWNMGGTAGTILMYGLALVALVIFAIGLRRRIRFWRRGKPDAEGWRDWGRRFWILVRETLLQVQTRRRFLPGLFHSLIFYSFLWLFVTTLIVMVDMDFHLRIFHGGFYLFVSLLADIAGACLFAGVAIAAVRRYTQKPDFLPETKPVDTLVLAILAFLALTGLLAEGGRIRFHPGGDPWKAWTPVGALFAGLLAGARPATGRAIHFATWWTHALGTFAMIAMIPYTKFVHMLAIPTNQLLSKLAAKGTLQRVDIEALLESDDAGDDFTIGVADGRDLARKQRLDLIACIECGRCDAVCPARTVEQPLSPRRLVSDLKVMLEQGGGDGGAIPIAGAEGTVFADEQFIWHCRTCHACQSICPAAIAHVDLFIELRRAAVMMEGRLPVDAGKALKTMEAQGNPFGSQAERVDLVEKLGIPVLAEGGETEVLFWIGCTATFDPQKHALAADMVALMKRAGVRFAHLGRDETCCGDPARVLGDENLFQATAKQVVAALQARTFQWLLVMCPHGYNVFKHEYPQFGGRFPVVHHTELLARWIREGRLVPAAPVPEKVAYHDPCYLGRYQGILGAPREVLRSIPGLDLREMKDRGRESFCCGAGGGHLWMDIDQGERRTYTHRVDQAAAAGAETIAVGCAFCYQMLTDGLKGRNLDERMKVVDVVNLVRRSVEP